MKQLLVMKPRYLLACVGVSLMLSGAVLAGNLPAFVAPKFMRVTVVADSMVLNGMKMKTAEFRARGTVADIMAFYMAEWDNEVKTSKVAGMRILSHYDGKHLHVVQVEDGNTSLQSDTVHGLLSISDPDSLPARIELGKGFPMPSSSTVVNDIVSHDLGKKSRTLLFFNDRGVQGNLSFYRRHFTKKGWVELPQEDKAKAASTSAALVMNKGGDELNMAFSSQDGKTSVMAVMVEK